MYKVILVLVGAGLIALSYKNNFMPYAEFLEKCQIISIALTIPISVLAAISIYRKFGLKNEVFGTLASICGVPVLVYFLILLLISSSYPTLYTTFSESTHSIDVEAVKRVNGRDIIGCRYRLSTKKTPKEFSAGEICIPKSFAALVAEDTQIKFRLTGKLSTFGLRVDNVSVLND